MEYTFRSVFDSMAELAIAHTVSEDGVTQTSTSELPTEASVLTKFEPFPRLATELRQLVFKHALPSLTDKQGRRVLQVNGSTAIIGRESRQPATFMVYVPYEYCDLPEHPDVYDTGLLGACHESREVFLKAFPNSLQATYGGLIRFDDDTFIHIQNFCEVNEHFRFLARDKMYPYIFRRDYLPPHFKSIKKLAMYGRDFTKTFFDSNYIDPLFLFPDVDTVSVDIVDSNVHDYNIDTYYRSWLNQLTVGKETSTAPGDILIEKAKTDLESIGYKGKDLSRYNALEFINWKCEGPFLELPDRYFRFYELMLEGSRAFGISSVHRRE